MEVSDVIERFPSQSYACTLLVAMMALALVDPVDTEDLFFPPDQLLSASASLRGDEKAATAARNLEENTRLREVQDLLAVGSGETNTDSERPDQGQPSVSNSL